MKQQIHAYRGHGEIAVEGHNVKLGRGGIREIEFFVQTQQLIAGGRHHALRGRAARSPMLAALAADGWIDAAARDELTPAYDFLRRVEHRLQMMADEQTHTLPADTRRARWPSPAFSVSPAATISPPRCSRSCARSRSTTSGCSRARRLCSRSSRACRFRRPEGERRDARSACGDGFSATARDRRRRASLARAGLTAALRGEQAREISHRACAGRSSTSSRARKIPMRHLPPSTGFLSACAPAGASCRCCGRIPELVRLHRADPRRRAAARRYSGAAAAMSSIR